MLGVGVGLGVVLAVSCVYNRIVFDIVYIWLRAWNGMTERFLGESASDRAIFVQNNSAIFAASQSWTPQDDNIDNSWVDDFGKELGKRNLTFFIPEEKSEEVESREKPFTGACLDTLDCCDKDTSPNTTVCSIIEMSGAENNLADPQKYILRSLGVVPMCECRIRDIAAGALKIWLRNPFLIASLKRVVRVEDSVSTVVKQSLDIWKGEKH